MKRLDAVVAVSAFLLGAGCVAAGTAGAQGAMAPKTEAAFNFFLQGLGKVRKQYVAPVNEDDLVSAGLSAMVRSMDPHSEYLSPDDVKQMQDGCEACVGLGMQVTSQRGFIQVQTVDVGGPADLAGIEPGDAVLTVDGRSVLATPARQVAALLRGEAGSTVALSMAREGRQPFDLKLTRKEGPAETVASRMEGAYGYIRVTALKEKTTDHLVEALKSLKADHPDMKGLVLDLRGNPGGLLDQVVGVADVFLDGGEVLMQTGRDPHDIQRYNARKGDLTRGLPMVVLIDQNTASGAEMIAAALQDHARAPVVGLTSFGTGTVQTMLPLAGGQQGWLKLTTSRIRTPAGHSIQGVGVTPDLPVARSAEQAARLKDGRARFSESVLPNAIKAEPDKAPRPPAGKPQTPPAGFDAAGDYQLDRALAVLTAGSVKALRASEPPPPPAAPAPAGAPPAKPR